MAELNRDGLLKKQELKIEKVVLESGDHTYVKQMNGRARDRWEQSIMSPVKDAQGRIVDYERVMDDFRAKLACATVCDSQGNLILTHRNDIDTLSQNMSAKDLEVIVTKAQELNRITDQDRDNLLKNLESGQTADSTSDLQEN